MVPAGAPIIVENILIVNVNKKFTFLNSIKTLDENKIIEKGKIKCEENMEMSGEKTMKRYM